MNYTKHYNSLWRCENERMLMAMYGIDSEEGEDIPQQGKSYFLDLLQQGAVNHLRWFNSSLQTTRSCWSSSSTMRSRSTSTRRRGTRGREQRPNLPSSSRRRPSSKLDQTCVRSFRVWTNFLFGQHFYLYLEINSSRPEPRHWNTSCHWGCCRESRTGSMTLSLPIPTLSMWWKTCQGDRIQPRKCFELNW